MFCYLNLFANPVGCRGKIIRRTVVSVCVCVRGKIREIGAEREREREIIPQGT